jgi:hypothetical protein
MTAALVLSVGVVLTLAALFVSHRTVRWAPFAARLLPSMSLWLSKDREEVRRASGQQVDGLVALLFVLGGACTLAGIAGLIAMA